MPKSYVNINFAQGVNTKADPWQVPAGQFLVLENSVFSKAGMLQKRNGYSLLTLADGSPSYITTLNDSLVAVSDSSVQALNASNDKWHTQGSYASVRVATLPSIRNSLNQSQCDSAEAPNGLVCTVFTQTVNSVNSYLYTISSAATGQVIVEPTALANAVGSPRVFVLDNYFVIIFTIHPTSYFLQYVAIPFARLFDETGAINSTTARVTNTSVIPATTVSWDGVVASGRLFVAFNTTSGGQDVKVTYLTQSNVAQAQVGVSPVSLTGAITATMIGVCVDTTVPNPQIYIAMYDRVGQSGFVAAVNFNLTIIFAPTPITGAALAWANITCVAQDSVCHVFAEQVAAYSYDSSIPTNFITAQLVSAAGVVTSGGDPVHGVGLASKAFVLNSRLYVWVAYQSPFQPTYFLMDVTDVGIGNANVISKLAYENGGGYLPAGLPSVTVNGMSVSVSYLYKDLVQALTTQQNTTQTTTGGVYSQTGVNRATVTFGSQFDSAEIASSLHFGGGFLWHYDGFTPVEQNFFLWPDSVEATWSATGGAIAAKPDGATNTNAYYYQALYEWTDNAGNIHRSAPSIPVAVTTTGAGTAGTITINVPTIRLTYKTDVKIVIYRWSVANQVYHQVTSITNPVLNDKTTNSITFADKLADASIQGNSIIYTTGGVVEDVNAPATSIVTLFDTRLWMVDDEDRNLLWFSKQVIEATPVEMSDLFTFYIAPTSGSQGSTGPMTALAPMDDKLVLFKNNAIYYINGTGPDNTGANNQYSQPIFVTSTVGCSNQQSIVFMPNGLMFQSDKGIWLLDRSMNTTYIGAPVEGYTQNATVRSALNIPGTNQVRFTLSSGVTLMYDYFYEQWGTFVNVPAISACVYEGVHTYLNDVGQVLQETPGAYTDNGEPTLMAFTTSWFAAASLQGFERAYYVYLLGQYYSPHYLNVGVAYDFVPGPVQTSLIRPDNFSSAVPSPYGDQSAPFGAPTALEQWQVYFKRQKCMSFQLSVQEIYDPTLGVPAGAGFTLSGLSLAIMPKRGTRPLAARKSVG